MTEIAITFCVCSNRPENLSRFLARQSAALGPHDQLLLVADTCCEIPIPSAVLGLGSRGCVVQNGSNRGLSFSRNLALRAARTTHLVFLDDDVVIDRDVVKAIRESFVGGADLVGVRLCLPPSDYRLPWYLSEGQLHYLGVHGGSRPYRTWGACMGVNVALAERYGVHFRDDLGRKGQALASGDDTTFVAEMRRHGAREAFLDDSAALHYVDVDRLRISYLLRRTYWQGRSEFRRGAVWAGFRKEWGRYTGGPEGRPRRYLLAAAYALVFCSGIVVELARKMWPRRTRCERGKDALHRRREGSPCPLNGSGCMPNSSVPEVRQQ